MTDKVRSKTQKWRKHVSAKTRFTIYFIKGHEIRPTFGKKSFLSRIYVSYQSFFSNYETMINSS